MPSIMSFCFQEINGTTVVVNETIHKSKGDDGNSFFHIKVIQIGPNCAKCRPCATESPDTTESRITPEITSSSTSEPVTTSPKATEKPVVVFPTEPEGDNRPETETRDIEVISQSPDSESPIETLPRFKDGEPVKVVYFDPEENEVPEGAVEDRVRGNP